MHMRGFFAWVCLALLFSVSANAGTSLPLQGGYRPGRYMPVRVTADSGTLSADGALSTLWSGGAGVVPVLIYGSPRELATAEGERLPLHVVAEHERLVAFTPEARQGAVELFPSAARIDVPLDAADPLPGPIAAWEALDAVVLSVDQMRRIDDDRRSALLGAGVTLAVAGDAAPDAAWPWHREGPLWVLRYTLLGPRDELVNPSAFAPTLGWSGGWPAGVRGQVVAAGALLGIVVVALTMWRARSAVIALTIVIIAATGAIAAWRRQLGNVMQAGGDVVVVDPPWVQRDSWLYERARQDAPRQVVRWAGVTHPVFASAQAMADAGLRLMVDTASGETKFEHAASRGQVTAFVRRTVHPGQGPSIGSDRSSPMWELAKDVYAAPGSKIRGEEASTQLGRWPAVVIDQGNR
jgi:hypothetical protein